jgi:hypothetical protein
MKSITIIADDKVGLLADISYILGKAKVNIDALSVDVVAKKAVVILTVPDSEKARQVLEASGYTVTEANMIVVRLPDEPGELGKITTSLAKQGINIENVQTLSRDGRDTVLGILVDKPKKANEMLKPYLLNKSEPTY